MSIEADADTDKDEESRGLLSNQPKACFSEKAGERTSSDECDKIQAFHISAGPVRQPTLTGAGARSKGMRRALLLLVGLSLLVCFLGIASFVYKDGFIQKLKAMWKPADQAVLKSPTVSLVAGEELILVLAEMSKAIYDLDTHSMIWDGTFEGVIYDAGYKWQNTSGGDCFQQSEFRAGQAFVPSMCVATKEEPKQAVIAIKGTSSLSDVVADIGKVAGGERPMVALNKLRGLVTKYEQNNYTVMVTGHSLGGYMAEIASTTLNLPGIAFNAPGPDGPLRNHNGNRSNPYFRTINSWNDNIGNLNAEIWTHRPDAVYIWSESHKTSILMQQLDKVEHIDLITNKNLDQYIKPYFGNFVLGQLPMQIEQSWRWLTCWEASAYRCGPFCCCGAACSFNPFDERCRCN